MLLKLQPFCECSTEEIAAKIAGFHQVQYVYTGQGQKPWLVVGSSEALQQFERFTLEMQEIRELTQNISAVELRQLLRKDRNEDIF